MIFLAQLAMRNLFRNTRRSIITAMVVVFGVALQILGWGLIDGIDESFLRALRTTTTADLILRPDGYPTDGLTLPLDATVVPPAGLSERFRGEVAERTLFQGRIVKGAEASRVTGIAYDAVQDPTVFPRSNWTIEGSWPVGEGDEVVLGTGIAGLVGASVGDSVVIQTRTLDGAQNAYSYTVTGIVRTDNNAIDNAAAWLERRVAERLLTLGDRRSHLAIKLAPGGDPVAAKSALAGLGWQVLTTEEEAADLLAINTIRRVALAVVVFIIMTIAALGIANTVIMAAYERIREIGTLLSLGMRRRDVSGMFLLEGLVLGLCAGVVGAGLGVAAVTYGEVHPLVLPQETLNAGRDMAISAYIYTKLRWPPVFLALFFSAAIAVLASVWPARWAAGQNPADAVRAD